MMRKSVLDNVRNVYQRDIETSKEEEDILKQKKLKNLTDDFQVWKNHPYTARLIYYLEKMREDAIVELGIYSFKPDNSILDCKSVCAKNMGKIQVLNDLLYNDLTYLIQGDK